MVDFFELSISLIIGIPKIISIVAHGVRQFDSLADRRSARNSLETYLAYSNFKSLLKIESHGHYLCKILP